MKKKKRKYSAIEERSYCPENPVQFIKRWRRNIRYACQRVKYGYCEKDVWSIDQWFLNVVPNMLQVLRETTHGYPGEFAESGPLNSHRMNEPDEQPQQGAQKWDAILAEMIHLLREANEDTCEMKNPCEEEYDRCSEEFDRKYGVFGEKLKTEEERKEEKEKKFYRVHTMTELPEYREIVERYFEEEKKINKYRNECKNQGLELFSRWFWDLWD